MKFLAAAAVLGSVLALATGTSATPGSAGTDGAPKAPSHQQIAERIANENPALISRLTKAGAVVSDDHRWIDLKGGGALSLVPMSLADCPSGWVCLYQDAGWNGRMLKWSDPGTAVDLTAAGFNDQLSSWSNKGGHYAAWYKDAGFSGQYCMTPHTNNTYVGSSQDNEASSFKIFNTATC